MKIAVSSYSFNKYMMDGTMTQFDCIQKAKDLGYDGVEFTDLCPPDNTSQKEYAKMIREECERVGIPVVNYAVYADFLTDSDSDSEREIERVRGQAEIAALLGSPCLRHDAATGYPPGQKAWRGFDNALPQLAEGCRGVTEYAAALGVKTMTENHGFFCQDSMRVEKIVNAVAHDNFGLLVDMGNFLCVDEDPVAAVGRTAPYAFHVHAKDFIIKTGEDLSRQGFFVSRGGRFLRGTVIGHGDVPVRSCIAALTKAGYDGCIGVEFEGVEPTEWALKAAIENLRRYLG